MSHCAGLFAHPEGPSAQPCSSYMTFLAARHKSEMCATKVQIVREWFPVAALAKAAVGAAQQQCQHINAHAAHATLRGSLHASRRPHQRNLGAAAGPAHAMLPVSAAAAALQESCSEAQTGPARRWHEDCGWTPCTPPCNMSGEAQDFSSWV